MNLEALPPRLLRWLDANFLCEVPTRERVVALTFDDGPDPESTPRVLEALARGNHGATFFCIGRNARRHPALVRAAAAAGHEIANHTFSHPPLTFVPRRRLLEELRRADWVLSALTGEPPLHFRPPMGWATPAVLRAVAEEGYRPVLGTIYPADPRAPDARAIVRRAIARLAPGRILILHDGSSRGISRARTVEALPAILAQMEARGLRGVSVRELLARAAGPAPDAAVNAARAHGRRAAGAPGSR